MARRPRALLAAGPRVPDGTVRSADLSSPNDFRHNMPRFREGALDALAVVDVVRAVAEQQGATPAQVALAWLRYRSEAMGVAAVPIPAPGARRASRRTSGR